MIGQLRGVLLKKQPPQLLIDVNGVGYEIEAPMSSFYGMPDTGEEVLLHTHLVVRDDAHLLFGFATQAERRMFRALIKVNGVGAKMALAILSGVSTQDFARYVQAGDALALTRLPGIGKKTAERLVVEMRDRLDTELHGPESHGTGMPGQPPGKEGAPTADPIADAVIALEALGYGPQEASRLVRAVDTAGLTTEEVIRRALQHAVKR
jgi:Holliday junction DNA helicase RuvA